MRSPEENRVYNLVTAWLNVQVNNVFDELNEDTGYCYVRGVFDINHLATRLTKILKPTVVVEPEYMSFHDRIMDARKKLKAGAGLDLVKEIHGGIVLREALNEKWDRDVLDQRWTPEQKRLNNVPGPARYRPEYKY